MTCAQSRREKQKNCSALAKLISKRINLVRDNEVCIND